MSKRGKERKLPHAHLLSHTAGVPGYHRRMTVRGLGGVGKATGILNLK